MEITHQIDAKIMKVEIMHQADAQIGGGQEA